MAIYGQIWPYTGKYGHIWPWFRSQSHSKAIVFSTLKKNMHAWPHLPVQNASPQWPIKIVEAVWPKKHVFLVSQASKCSQNLPAQNGGNPYRFESESRNVVRYDCSVRCFSLLLRAIFQRLAVTRSQAQAHANIGHVFDAEDEHWPETRCNQWTSMQGLMDIAMALLCQYPQCNFSCPMRLQFLWKDGREILVLKASFRIRLVVVIGIIWNPLATRALRIRTG